MKTNDYCGKAAMSSEAANRPKGAWISIAPKELP